MRIIHSLLLLLMSSCINNMLEEEAIEQLPEFTREELASENESKSEPINYIVEFDSIDQINMEQIKAPTVVRHTPNGPIIFKIHSNNLPIHCASKNFGSWKFIGIEIHDDFEIRTIDKGSIYQEIWQEETKIATLYYLKDKDGKNYVPSNLWYDENFIRGYIHESNIISETIPERELEKIILQNDLSLSAFQPFIWRFNLKFGGDSTQESENFLMFHMFPAHIDGESAPDRLLLVFENKTLVALKHDRPLNIKTNAVYNCDSGLTLSIIAKWDSEKIESFTHTIMNCE